MGEEKGALRGKQSALGQLRRHYGGEAACLQSTGREIRWRQGTCGSSESSGGCLAAIEERFSRHLHEDFTFELRRAAPLHGATILGHGGAHDYNIGMLAYAQGFDLRCGAGKSARVWVQGKGGALKPSQAMVLLPLREGEDENSIAGYLAPLRQTLIDNNDRHVNVVVCESDYRALKRGIEHLPPPLQ